MVGNEVLAGAVGFHDGADHVLRYVVEVGEQLFGVFGQTVAAVTEAGVVVMATDARIKAHAVDNLAGVEALGFGVGVQLVEVAHTQCQVGVGEQLHGFRLGEAHEQGVDPGLERALLQQGGELTGAALGGGVVAHDDAAGIEVVVECLALA